METPKYFMDLHSKVAIGIDRKEEYKHELDSGVIKLRKEFIKNHARGNVLETCVGNNKNIEYYDENLIKSFTGIDWIQYQILEADKRLENR